MWKECVYAVYFMVEDERRNPETIIIILGTRQEKGGGDKAVGEKC